MSVDAGTVLDLLERLGGALTKPTTLCLIGSAPGILIGQPDRQTGDLDVWNPASSYDAADLRTACRSSGVLYDPVAEIGPDDLYVQIVRRVSSSCPRASSPRRSGVSAI